MIVNYVMSFVEGAPMERFFYSLNVELAHHCKSATREEAKHDLFQYIDGYYNRVRIHPALGYKTPEQAERSLA
jgi:putative transposase